ncbi:MAG: response regulator transcription factor [Actinomycetota bacterium]|nr:response regulator transcription factor [Actinomycetota bacterium]MDA3015585.1 response regulator transcription factor [Actinomycetota bacterium]MDA3028452.1 response regulator transcription factor [Actinomycetota bacterium]
MIRVLLVDDQEVVREGLRSLIATDRNLTVVGECSDGDEVIDHLDATRPDVVVMDIRMRRVDGATATAAVRAANGPPVLVLTTFDDDETLAAALRAGAAGFVVKSAPGEDILRAITTVAAGDAWIDPRVAGRVLAAYRASRPRAAPDLSALTERELEVLTVVGRGLTNREAADTLYVSEATIKTHLGRVLAKLGLRDRSAAIVFVHDHDLR